MEQHKPKNPKKQSKRHQAFLEHQNQCPLCGSELEIKVESYVEGFHLREEAHCTNCDLLARIKDHKMH